MHEPHQEHPRLAPVRALVDGDLEEVDLRAVTGAVDQRHEDFGLLASELPQVLTDRRDPDLVALVEQLAVKARAGDPLLGRRPALPVGQQGVDPVTDPLEHRPGSRRTLDALGLAHREVLAHRIATDSHLAGHFPLTSALAKDLVSDNMDLGHL